MKAEVRAVGLLLLSSSAILLASVATTQELFFDFGPNDLRYVTGFREDFEIDEPTLIHWTGTRATLTLPFTLRGPYEVRLRYKRHVAVPAEVRFYLEGEPVQTVVVPQRDFEVLTLQASGGGSPFELGITSHSEDPRPLGIALDWMQVVPERRFTILPTPSAFAWVLSWIVSFYAAGRLLSMTRRVSLAWGLAAAAGLALASASHVNWPTHATSTLGLRFLVFAFGFVAVFRLLHRRSGSAFASTEARWVVMILLFGTAARLLVLFHPDFYYPDVRTHSKFVSLIWTEGFPAFFSDFIQNQHRHLLGLQYVSDRWLAFPYPPLLYLTIYPLSLLELPVEEWMKLVPTALLAVEGLLLFALAQRLGLTRRAALVAAALHATAGVLGFRLAVASFAALFGHFWDTVAVVYLVYALDRLTETRYGLGLYALVTLSLLSYAGSALVLGFLMPFTALALYASKAPLKRCLAIAGWSLAAAVTAFFVFYAQYIPELFLGGGGGAAGGGAPGLAAGGLVDLKLTPWSALTMSAYRMRLFYGVVFSGIALAGLFAIARSGASPTAKALTYAVCGTYFGLNFLRAGLGETHIFQFTKDDLVVTGFVTFTAGMLVDRLVAGAGGWPRKLLGAGLVLLWVVLGVRIFAREVQSRFIHPGRAPVAVGVTGTNGLSGGVDDLVPSGPLRAV